MSNFHRLLAVITAALCLSTAARAQPPTVTGAWARATAPGQDSGVVYATLRAPSADSLASLSSPDADAVMLHRTTHAGGMSGMEDAGALALPAGADVRLSPGGTHIMLMNLHHPLQAGSTIELDLRFTRAGSVKLRVPVQPITASGPPG